MSFIKPTILLFAVFFSFSTFAQSIKGIVADTSQKKLLKEASVSLLDAADSTLEQFVLTKQDGSFEINKLSAGSYLLQITYINYSPFFRKIAISNEKNTIDIGTVYMQPASTNLQDVTVVQTPINIKKDTVEYNASSFKTKPNAMAEDLLKKLPGVEVSTDGTIKAQGEQVKRVLVDGKRFFGDDPTMATRNLPPDVIDKIQVFDDLSDQSKFTGFDDGNRVKTINITTRKDKRKGYFGKAAAGAGTDDKYDAMLNLHRFENTNQISILGQANNINKQNFSNQDILGSTGGGGGRGARGGGNGGGAIGGGGNAANGIATTYSGGANMRNDWKNNSSITGSYFYNRQKTSTIQSSLTQNIINTDSSTYNDQTQNDLKRNYNHRINLNLEENIDSANTITFRPNIAFQKTGYTTQQSSALESAKNLAIYNNQYQSAQNNSGYNGSADLMLKHKFKKQFRTTSVSFNFSRNKNDGVLDNNSINDYFIPIKTDSILQNITTATTGYTFSPTLSYTEPLAKNQMLEVNYNFNYTQNTAQRFTYNQQKILDSIYSNDFENTYHSNRVTLSYRLQNEKYNFNAGSGIQFGELASNNATKKSILTQQYVNITPTANFTYNFSRTNTIRINYMGRTGQPSITQLQPVTITNDSINFSKGNAALKQQFTHTLRFIYTNFNIVTQRVMFASLNASTIVNDIQNSVIYLRGAGLKRGSQLTMPVNLGGTFNINGYFNYGFALKKPKSNLNFTTNISHNQTQNLVDSQSNYTRNTTLGETIGWTTNLKEKFDVNFKSTTNYNIAKYSLQPTQNANYFTQILSVEATYYTKSGWNFSTQFDYTFNGNRNAGYNTSIPLLSPAISKQLFKNKAGEIKLSVFDLLNQNTSITRTISNNTITDTRTNTLTRYGMLTFTYNLRNFANKRDGKMPGFMQGTFRNFRQAGGGGRDF